MWCYVINLARAQSRASLLSRSSESLDVVSARSNVLPETVVVNSHACRASCDGNHPFRATRPLWSV